MKKKLSQLEAIRGFAAIYVVFHHTFSTGLVFKGHDFSFIFRFGQEAVILFFLISGFVIKYSFEKSNDKSFWSYFKKRFLRIYIPIIIIFITDYFVQAWQARQFFQINWMNLSGNILMLQDNANLKTNVITGPFLGNTPLWSLSYEWWFYMLFFFIIVRFKSKASNVVYLLALVSAVSYIFYPFFINRLLMYMAIWWAGVEIADLYLKNQHIGLLNLKKPLLVLSMCAGILLLNAKVSHYEGLGKGIGFSPWLEVRHFGFAIAAILIALLWKKIGWRYFSSTIGRFEIFSTISYGVYISHYFLVSRAHYLDFINNQSVRFIAYFVICIAFAYLVEKVLYVRLRNFLDPVRKINSGKNVVAVAEKTANS